MKEQSIYLVNGPNLNLLGKRQPDIYGNKDLPTLERELTRIAQNQGVVLNCFQSNHEGELVEYIHTISPEDYLLINAAAYTHTSVALRDAILAKKIPTIEIHLSNIYSREDFRQRSYLRDVALGIIMGLGEQSYHLALQYCLNEINNSK